MIPTLQTCIVGLIGEEDHSSSKSGKTIYYLL